MPQNIVLTWNLLLAIIGALIAIASLIFVKKSDTRKMWGWIGGVVFVVFLVLTFTTTNGAVPFLDGAVFGGGTVIQGGGGNTATLSIGSGNAVSGNATPNTNPSGIVSTYAPTATYSTTDPFSQTTSITGTSYYGLNGAKLTTASITNPGVGATIEYYVDNRTSAGQATYFTMPVQSFVVQNQNPNVPAIGFSNNSATLTAWDLVGQQKATNGANNVTLGANGNAKVQLTYTGTSKGSASPFGGVFVSEYNNTMASVTCTDGGVNGQPVLSANSGLSKFHVTYTPTYTTNVQTFYEYNNLLDNGNGNSVVITCNYKNGGTADGAGSAVFDTFIPANYFVSGTLGHVVLDTEKNADGSTTRTGSNINKPTLTFYWAN